MSKRFPNPSASRESRASGSIAHARRLAPWRRGCLGNLPPLWAGLARLHGGDPLAMHWPHGGGPRCGLAKVCGHCWRASRRLVSCWCTLRIWPRRNVGRLESTRAFGAPPRAATPRRPAAPRRAPGPEGERPAWESP